MQILFMGLKLILIQSIKRIKNNSSKSSAGKMFSIFRYLNNYFFSSTKLVHKSSLHDFVYTEIWDIFISYRFVYGMSLSLKTLVELPQKHNRLNPNDHFFFAQYNQ